MFDLVGPCKNCPFRNDKLEQKGWLGSARAQDIFDNLKDGGFFPCHKTHDYVQDEEDYNEYDDECENEPKFKIQDQHQFCAGALILMEKTGAADRSQIIQIAERLRMYKKDKLRIDASPVFNSELEFVQWHGDKT